MSHKVVHSRPTTGAKRRPCGRDRGRWPRQRQARAALLDLVEEFRSIVAALEAADVEFAVCGGLAVAIHAHPRATLDVDLLLPRDQIDRRERSRAGWDIRSKRVR